MPRNSSVERSVTSTFETWLQGIGVVDSAGRALQKSPTAAIAPAIALIDSMAG